MASGWQQAVQELAERHDKAYQRFFAYKAGKSQRRAGRPGFKKVKQCKSFTLKQTGWKYPGANKVTIQGVTYKFSLSRPIAGEIKTVTVKRDKLGHLWVCFSVIQEVPEPVKISTGKIGGFDFGLQTFLTDHEGKAYHSPQFLKAELNELARLNRCLSRRKQGSNNWHKARRQLATAHRRIADKRRDVHWKLAHRLCREFDLLCFETLNISGMKRLWGRKVSNLGFSQFFVITQQVAAKTGSQVQPVDKWEPTTQACFRCLCRQSMLLSVRHFDWRQCGWSVPRDQNAALNILAAGASAAGLGEVRRQLLAAISDGPTGPRPQESQA